MHKGVPGGSRWVSPAFSRDTSHQPFQPCCPCIAASSSKSLPNHCIVAPRSSSRFPPSTARLHLLNCLAIALPLVSKASAQPKPSSSHISSASRANCKQSDGRRRIPQLRSSASALRRFDRPASDIIEAASFRRCGLHFTAAFVDAGCAFTAAFVDAGCTFRLPSSMRSALLTAASVVAGCTLRLPSSMRAALFTAASVEAGCAYYGCLRRCGLHFTAASVDTGCTHYGCLRRCGLHFTAASVEAGRLASKPKRGSAPGSRG